jgi:predicted nuclease with TOPRIM domain
MPTEGRTGPMVDSSFSVIEKKISDIAGVVVALKKEKASLADRLEKKEAEVQELARKVTDLTKERNEIRNKVEMILGRIESIEL